MLSQITFEPFRQLHLIIGMVKDKDISGILQMLPSNAFYYFTQANIPRALPAHELREKAGAFGLNGESYLNVNDALNSAKENAANEDLILVAGSIFLVAEVNISNIKNGGGQALPTHT